jgi:hypothetical protein
MSPEDIRGAIQQRQAVAWRSLRHALFRYDPARVPDRLENSVDVRLVGKRAPDVGLQRDNWRTLRRSATGLAGHVYTYQVPRFRELLQQRTVVTL